ncbi:MAG: hypothetical protein WCW67_04680 [Candidatus Margulisiibacteriota bacterium]|jgi:Sec-independent protein translocase protein TatA
MVEITLNQIAVLIEKVGADVKTVAEGQKVFRSEMAQMKQELNEKIEANNSALKWVAKDLGGRIDEVKKALGEVKEKVWKIERTLDAHVKLPVHA